MIEQELDTLSGLTKLNKNYYYNSYGYYIYQDKKEWIFLAKEKYYNTYDLLNISNILNILNEITHESII